MTEPQQPYGPPPVYGVPGSTPGAPPPAWTGSPGAPTGPAGYGLDPAGYGPAPLGDGWPPAPHTGPQETEAKAAVALVLALLAYTPLVPFVGAIAALVLARMAERDIDRSGGRKTGRGLVKAARILSWLHLVFVALVAVALVLFFLLPIGLSASA